MQNLNKKILILSWFFPSSTMPAALRTYAMAKYLNHFGYYPTIVTRKWDEYQSLINYYNESKTKNIDYIKNARYQVFLLPYNPSLRDRLANKNNYFLVLFRKILSSINFLLFPMCIKISLYYPIYFFSDKLLKKSKYDLILATGNPFELFKIAKKLSNRNNIPYVIDYRNDWSSNYLNFSNSIFDRLKRKLYRKFEKSWSSECLFFTSVTPLYVEKIRKIIDKPGVLIYNGYFSPLLTKTEKKEFTFIYSGQLYYQQNIEILFKAVSLFKTKMYDHIKIFFIGNGNSNNLYDLIDKYELYDEIIISPRVTAIKIHEYYNLAFAFLLFSYGEIKGIITSKIFEYLSYQKPILLCPSDNDIMEEMLIKTKTGLIANTVEECFTQLSNLYDQFLKKEKVIEPNMDEILKYSRKYQIKKLAESFDKYL